MHAHMSVQVLIGTFTPYQIGEKAQRLRKNGTFLRIQYGGRSSKERGKFACTNVTPKLMRHTAHE